MWCVCGCVCVLIVVRTLGRVWLMIAAVWILSVVVSLPPLFGWKRPQPVVDGFPQCVLSEETGYVIYSTIGSFYVPLVVIVVVYSKIYVAARARARRNLTALSQGQKSRRSRRQMTQSVTTASNLSGQPRSVPPSNVVQDMAEVQLQPPAATHLTAASQAAGGLVCLTPSTDPGGSWSDATVSDSKPGEVAAEPDSDLERDDEALSDVDLDSDEDDAGPQPQVVFSTGVTGDVAETVPQRLGPLNQSAGYDQAPASMAGPPSAVPSASQTKHPSVWWDHHHHHQQQQQQQHQWCRQRHS